MRVSKLPIEVPYYSVIGQRPSGPKELRSDGVLPTRQKMRTFKTKARNGALVVGARIGPAEPHRPLDVRKKRGFSGFFASKLPEKLLDDPEALLYCDPEFDRQLVNLYHKPKKTCGDSH